MLRASATFASRARCWYADAGRTLVARLGGAETPVRAITYPLYVITGIGTAGLVEDAKSFLGREQEGVGRECATPAPPSVWRSLRWLRLFVASDGSASSTNLSSKTLHNYQSFPD